MVLLNFPPEYKAFRHKSPGGVSWLFFDVFPIIGSSSEIVTTPRWIIYNKNGLSGLQLMKALYENGPFWLNIDPSACSPSRLCLDSTVYHPLWLKPDPSACHPLLIKSILPLPAWFSVGLEVSLRMFGFHRSPVRLWCWSVSFLSWWIPSPPFLACSHSRFLLSPLGLDSLQAFPCRIVHSS